MPMRVMDNKMVNLEIFPENPGQSKAPGPGDKAEEAAGAAQAKAGEAAATTQKTAKSTADTASQKAQGAQEQASSTTQSYKEQAQHKGVEYQQYAGEKQVQASDSIKGAGDTAQQSGEAYVKSGTDAANNASKSLPESAQGYAGSAVGYAGNAATGTVSAVGGGLKDVGDTVGNVGYDTVTGLGKAGYGIGSGVGNALAGKSGKEEPKQSEETQNLINDSTFSDAVITSGDTKYNVHRFIVVCYSEYSKKLFGDKRELQYSHIVNTFGSHVKLDSGDARAFPRVKYYFYASDFDGDLENGDGGEFKNALEVNAAVYALADKYESPGLKKKAIKKFGQAAKDMILDREALEAIRIVYNSTSASDRGLRDICVTLWAVAGASMMAETEREAFQDFLGEVPGFGVDIAMRFASTMSKAQILEACSCHQNVYYSGGKKRDLKEAMEHNFTQLSVTVSQTSKLDVFWS